MVSPKLVEMLHGVLRELTYPAQPWQIIMAAESYGAAAHTVTRLHRLPRATYSSLDDIAHAFAHATGAPPDPAPHPRRSPA